MEELSHLDGQGRPRMVDVGSKEITQRTATARCSVELGTGLLADFTGGDLITKKGGVIQTAVVAGIMAAKQTSALIPMCHPLPLDHCAIEIVPDGPATLAVTCTCKTSARTGVEMEALTGASVAALTVYDMCKARNPAIVISALRLLEKRGGKSDYSAPA
ncbi:MAG: cyclic pyranopterin monophosphate synthase MoaC [Akkermansiaceae bacterium]|nr:cyclic pyranopterin monophosphate synthase MoaC [Akkermansiaceae bacterium]